MNEEIRWLSNDEKVDDLRNRMIKVRQEFRNKNPNASENTEERYLTKIFQQEAQTLMKEQIGIIASGLRSKNEKYLY